MKNKTLLEKRLKSYSALAAGMIVLGGAANAQVVYTDIDPDLVADQGGESYELDLNNDGNIDFLLKRTTPYTDAAALMLVANEGNEVLGAISSTSWFLPYMLEAGDTIDAEQATWDGSIHDGEGSMANVGYGYWGNDETDKYLGLRILTDDGFKYGWIRLDVTADGNSFTAKDYAFESTAGVGLEAGEVGIMPVNAAVISDLSAQDIGNNDNGSDLQVDFTTPEDQSTISEYRIMVVYPGQVENFDLEAANAVTSDNYTVVNMDAKGAASIVLDAAATTIDGTAITNDSYNIFVLSIADGTNANTNALSSPSEQIELRNTIGVPELDSKVNIYSYSSTVVINANEVELVDAFVTIYDMVGRQVYQDALVTNEARIEFDNNTNKFYLVKLTTPNGQMVKKVFVN